MEPSEARQLGWGEQNGWGRFMRRKRTQCEEYLLPFPPRQRLGKRLREQDECGLVPAAVTQP